MKVTKKVIGELEKCYSLALLHYQGKEHFLCAAEKNSACYLFSLAGEAEDIVWNGPGGVMTMVEVPRAPGVPDGQFLATKKFYSPNNGKGASIVVVTPRGKGDWERRTLTHLPFVHRFGILQNGGRHYLIACALKSEHEFKNDWRYPGKVFAAPLPADLSKYDDVNPLELTLLKDGLLKNHGFYLHEREGATTAVVSSESGIYEFIPPASEGGAWEIRELTQDAASDALLLDLDGDGVEELCTIAPFHGDTVKIYREVNGKYELAWEYEKKLDFLHAIFGGKVGGKNMLILGCRKAGRELLAFTYENGAYQAELIDEGCGAANVLHYVYEGKDVLIAANREINEIARYELG